MFPLKLSKCCTSYRKFLHTFSMWELALTSRGEGLAFLPVVGFHLSWEAWPVPLSLSKKYGWGWPVLLQVGICPSLLVVGVHHSFWRWAAFVLLGVGVGPSLLEFGLACPSHGGACPFHLGLGLAPARLPCDGGWPFLLTVGVRCLAFLELGLALPSRSGS